MSTTTAVIIGGGVIGLSAAYHLARKQFGRIILLEKDAIGHGASSRAAGIITGHLWSETGVAARKISLALFRELSQELQGYTFHDVGCLNLFDAATWPEREKLLPLYDRLDVPYERLDAAGIHYRWPELHPLDDFIGLFDPKGGYSEPHEYVPALSRRVRQLGVEVREGQRVIGFAVAGGRATGVQTDAGFVAADVVICTVHVWTLRLMAQLERPLPMKALIHQRYVTAPLSKPARFCAVNANPLGGYVRPAHDNRLLVGGGPGPNQAHEAPDAAFHMNSLSAPVETPSWLRQRFTPFLPCLESVAWDGEKVGLISYAADGEPLLGPIEGVSGLYVGASFHSGGFAYNPVAGLLLAEYAADGRPQLDARAFKPDRFDAATIACYLSDGDGFMKTTDRRH